MSGSNEAEEAGVGVDASPGGSAFEFAAITKVYPPSTIALDRVSVSVATGAIHAFVGENGAGKSTLMKILAGGIRADSGTLTVKGRPVTYSSSADAMADGVGMVHQEILLVSELTVWENVVLGVEPLKRGRFGLRRIDRESARASVQSGADAFGLGLDAGAVVGDLTVAARQKVEIAKLLHRGADIMILDEPTAVLAPPEIPELFEELRRLRDTGRTVCFISHHLDEVLDLCDTVTVLRHGRVIATVAAADTDPTELARLMVEHDVVANPRPVRPAGAAVLEVRNLTWSGPGSGATLGPLDLSVRSGEIVGVAGVDGNGQDALVDCIVGGREPVAGTVRIAGTDCTGSSILDRRKLLAYVPAERKTAGSALDASIADNIAMTHHRLTERFSRRIGPFRLLNRRVMREAAERIIADYRVAAGSADAEVGTLSGGNQQKVILGRELMEPRPLVVLDQPTRGLDIGSVDFVHERILALRAEGRAVLLVSADLDEIQALSDRVVVLLRGRFTLDAPNVDLARETIGRAMLDESAGAAPSSFPASASPQRGVR